jgi:gluconolactonase
MVTEIPGVIAAGQRWTSVYQTTGNNGDGPIAADDGALLIAQNDNGVVLKVDAKGQTSPVHRVTNTGGALAMSSKGALFVASRGIGTAVLQLAPQRRVFVNSYQGDPLECLGGVINDLTADGKGGVYFTMGGVFYADPKGVVTRYGENLRTNGVILSPDEKTLYVTNGTTVVAFDVRPDGALASQRDFGKLPAGSGDGLAVDAAGRLYVTAGGGGGGASPGLYVFAADGKLLGHIPAPRNLITAAFSGPDKKTLFAIANDRQNVDVYTIPMIAQGYKGRAK